MIVRRCHRSSACVVMFTCVLWLSIAAPSARANDEGREQLVVFSVGDQAAPIEASEATYYMEQQRLSIEAGAAAVEGTGEGGVSALEVLGILFLLGLATTAIAVAAAS